MVIILGDRDHPEVAGSALLCREMDSLVVQSPADLPARCPAAGSEWWSRQRNRRSGCRSWSPYLAPQVKELLVHNTICNATEQRQAAAGRMAAEVDAVVVVGGRDSGNTLRLAELCSARQPNTHHVESAAEIDPVWFRGVRVVGITAGASTPQEQIEAVLARLKGDRAMSTGLPRVAIIGYPNVGKSTLYNRLTGTRDAVVAPEAGVTRDRKEGVADWIGRDFLVIDTGGIDVLTDEPLIDDVRLQAQQAVEEAAVVVFLVDGRTGVAPQDHEIAQLLRRSGSR